MFYPVDEFFLLNVTVFTKYVLQGTTERHYPATRVSAYLLLDTPTTTIHTHYCKTRPLWKDTPTTTIHTHYCKTCPLWKDTPTTARHAHYCKTHPPWKDTPTMEGHAHYCKTHPPWKDTPTMEGHALLTHPLPHPLVPEVENTLP